ncbi:MAG: VOC family protein [Saprospirales bacterium]|nr:VOC family protein [Saprospirales bacterium]
MARVIGIGGIFFKCKDPEKLKAWYSSHFGFQPDQYGYLFKFSKSDHPENQGYLQWSPFAADTTYFAPSEKEYMINYRVDDLEALVSQMQTSGVKFEDEIESFPYGKFIHLLDPEGNKIELWEPVDSGFDE